MDSELRMRKHVENVDTKERRFSVPLSALRELGPDFKRPPQPNLNNLDSVRKHVEWVVTEILVMESISLTQEESSKAACISDGRLP